MGIHTGPKDGDYATYVEVLTGGAGGTPGKVYQSKRASPTGWTVESEMPPLPDGFKPAPVAINPMVTPGANPAANVPNRQVKAQPDSLAARAAKRTAAAIFSLIAIGLAVMATTLLIGGFIDNESDVQEFLFPSVFLLIFAFMLFKGARSLRKDANAPTANLPPLTLISSKDKK